ncbi:uncharacterized protein B0T15DRAFT_481348 [Chaetomium strumarium]|uniref:Hydantoinase n=1 Tax=Chaetomium strumarium TaxID=1170767 RepID=A0AAJ0M5N5_9PEZI|nr:hypothetical protein B0T15DRAFT_481348 [Chaetomium strumarium]
MAPTKPRTLRIGVDVGGTNTDGVLLDPSTAQNQILAWHKSPTTAPDPSEGIARTIRHLLDHHHHHHHHHNNNNNDSSAVPVVVASVTIGTTAFVNAVVERDAARLDKVAVLRLCGPFSKHVPPCVDWPADLRRIVLGYYALGPEGEIVRGFCKEIRARGIRAVVVNGVFSPIDAVARQEERAAAVVRREVPGCEVVCTKEVANLGFLERENAAILNAAILRYARRTVGSFQRAVRELGMTCPVFVTQNDGTILSADMAARLPIRTFSSGPTNSMRGAAFLIQGQGQEGGEGSEGEAMMVVDIGGTTTDVGLLLPSGFPRQQAAYSELAGVRMNFSCPDIKSIGLGGGSIVRKGPPMTVGPDSVGYKLTKESVVFGGKTLTATDCAVCADPSLNIGNPELVKGLLTEHELAEFKAVVRSKLERIVDTMKTSPADLPVVLVGGGAIIAPAQLKGASKVLKPQWSQVANAIGAAIARVSAVVDTIRSTERCTTQQLLAELCEEALDKAFAAGATRESVEIVEQEAMPLQYIANKTRFIVRAVGDFDFSRTDRNDGTTTTSLQPDLETDETGSSPRPEAQIPVLVPSQEPPAVDIPTYRPIVRNRVWYINETDLSWISTGCYILGTGGGGSPYPSMILLRQLLRAGAVVRVVSPVDVPDDGAVGCGCGAGSPTVAIEKLQGDEMMEAQTELYKLLPGRPPSDKKNRPTHMIALEIGGANGLQGLTLGASANMDLPCVDGDWMGRAYPTKWQTTPVVFSREEQRRIIWAPSCIADGSGNVVVMPRASSDAQVERVLRAALAEMGSQVAAADPPVTGREMKRWVVENTVSQAWRIGRAVARAKGENRLDGVAETIVHECGGPGAARVLFKGKIVGVERSLRQGYVYGECIIEGGEVGDPDASSPGGGRSEGPTSTAGQFRGRIKIPFKNENIAAVRVPDDARDGELERQEDVLAIVPDLICVIDAQSGEAVGTPEYRYGLLVIVLGIAASEKWTSTLRGIELGGPKAFGFEHLNYQPLGRFVKPVSVIDEFDGASA